MSDTSFRPVRLPADTDVLRSLPKSCVSAEGKVQANAFKRRRINQRTGLPDRGVSVGIARIETEEIEPASNFQKRMFLGYGVGKLLVENIHNVQKADLYVEQNEPHHANIMNVPFWDEDEALLIADDLAEKTIVIIAPQGR